MWAVGRRGQRRMKKSMKKISQTYLLILIQAAVLLLLVFCCRGKSYTVRIGSRDWTESSTDQYAAAGELPAGIYQLNIRYHSNNTSDMEHQGCWVEMIGASENDAVSGDRIALPYFSTETGTRFYVWKPSKALVHAGRDANWTAEARIREVSITRDVFSSSAFLTFCAAVCFLLLDSVIYLFGRERKNREMIRRYLKNHALIWIIGGVILGILCWPLHKKELLRGHDLYYHLFRIYAIAAGWRNGMFPVRIEPAWYNGFGSASGVMYGSLLLWPAAFLYLVGVPLKTAYRLYMVGINLGTLFISYFSFLRISKSRKAATLGMTVYSLMIYRMTDLYTRAAVGEYTAMMFLPLLAAGTSMLIHQPDCDDKKREGRTAIVIGLSGLIQSHVLTLFIMGQVFLVYCLLNLRRTFRVKTILELLKAGLLTIGLNLWFLVPFLDYYTTQNFKVLHERYTLEEYTVRPQQIFSWRYLPSGSFNEDPSVCMPLSLGVVSLFIILLSIAAILMSRQRDERGRLTKLLIMTVLFLWMTTWRFPYHYLEEKAPGIYYWLAAIQFPFRYLSAGALLISLMAVYLVSFSEHQEPRWRQIRVGSALAAILSAAAIIQSLVFSVSYTNTAGSRLGDVWSADNDDSFMGGSALYIPDSMDEQRLLDDRILVNGILKEAGELEKLNISRRENDFIISSKQAIERDETIVLPLVDYKGYCVRFFTETGERLRTVPAQNTDGCVTVNLQRGFTGSARIFFREPWYWRTAEIFSLGLAGILIVWRKRGRSARTIAAR